MAVDLRQSSPTFGAWVVERLSSENKGMMWIPEGFAHGFLALSDKVEFLYKTTDYYAPEFERCIRWDDASLNIDRELSGLQPILSTKDLKGVSLDNADLFT